MRPYSLTLDEAITLLVKLSIQAVLIAGGWEISSCGLSECLEKAASAIGWKDKRGKENNRGVGIGSCIHYQRP